MPKYYFILLILFSLILWSCSTDPDPAPDNLDEQIGHMLMIGFRGFTVEESSHISSDIINYKIGGVVLFDRDVESAQFVRNIQSPQQVKNLVSQLQSLSSAKLLVAIDQEGGRVNRLKTNYGFPPSVSARFLGNINNLDTTAKYGEITATTLKELGINMNLAPVVDLNVNPDNPVIGAIERSFSPDPEMVTAHARELIKIHRKHKILTTLKHFPGHGSSMTDSHLGFTDVTNTWSSLELRPYHYLISTGDADVIMTAHIFNSNLDSTYPATLSRNIMTGILRDSLGYNGVIISDDMQMKAITDHYGLEEAIFNSINAGVDILIFSNNSAFQANITSESVRIIKKLITEGRISRERIRASYNRITQLKAKL
jgi:beta-N-acetylhexosaminidase